MGAWRYIEENDVSASYGLAADEYLMRGYESDGQERPPTLRLYTYKSDCALVGQFQDVETEINVAYCRDAGVPINRRPTGGGAIIMGDHQLGMALVASVKHAGVPDHPREIFGLYAAGIAKGLRRLGIEGSIKGRNDFGVNGRKIAGLGICRGNRGALLFHASLLVDLDVARMLRVLRISKVKLRDKVHDRVEENLTTVRREIGRPVSVSEVRGLMRHGFESVLGIKFVREPFTSREVQEIRTLEKEKYLDESWIFKRPLNEEMAGTSLQKTPGGLLRTSVSLYRDRIGQIRITGDFFAHRESLEELESELSGVRAREEEVRSVVARYLSKRVNPFHEVKEETLVQGVLSAMDVAGEGGSQTRPYGCFTGLGAR